jgi:hypothetical protein
MLSVKPSVGEEVETPCVRRKAGVQPMVELADKSVEQVPLCLVVPVSGGPAGIAVSECTRGVAQRGQHPDRADRGEVPILI